MGKIKCKHDIITINVFHQDYQAFLRVHERLGEILQEIMEKEDKVFQLNTTYTVES